MRLKTRRTVVHLALFSCALCFILFMNLSRSSGDKTFAWTRVRYRTTATSLPEARGICPGMRGRDKPALVVARVTADGDEAWLMALAEKYHLCLYTADAPLDEQSVNLQVPANRGHEAMAYLTFIIDNYDALPPGAVFIHGSRFAWHNDHPAYDNAKLLARLNVSAALEPWGYHNMRCDWSASTCSPDYGPSQNSLETRLNAKVQPWDARSVSDAALSHALVSLFGDSGDDVRAALAGGDVVKAQCCAQFVASRDRIRQHSREEYAALRQWLLDGGSRGSSTTSNAAPADDRVAGRIVSYIWHILFLPPTESDGQNLQELNKLACPTAGECYCRLYGLCDPINGGHCNPGSCYGQYVLPPDFSLPDDWAAAHA